MKFLVTPMTTFFNMINNLVSTVGITNLSVAYFLDIVIFTLIIKIILMPLTIKQTKSSAKMNEFQPKFKEIQEKYKNDPKKMQQKQMELQKELGVNPASGCLLILVQFPIFIAMYWVIAQYAGFENASFLWIKSLGQPDKYFILPIISGLTQYVSGLMMMPKGEDASAKSQKNMNLMMSLMFVVMLYKAKSALWLYWTISNLLQMLQQYYIMKIVMKKDENEAKLAK